jgi:hypothetical protein
MARKKGASPDELKTAFEGDVKFKSYKNDGSGFDEFAEGDEIMGVLLSIRDHAIKDKRTKLPKDIRVYSIRTADGSVKKIGGRTILDRMFDDIMDENGGYEVLNRRYSGPGYEYLQNRVVKLNRGDDSETSEGNPLGTYEVAVEED